MLTFHVSAAAQHASSIDSLRQLLQSASDLQRRTELYAALAKEYLPVNPDSAYVFAVTGLRLSNDKTPPLIKGELYHFIGNALVTRDSLDRAREAYLQAEGLYRQAKAWEELSIIYLLLGNIHFVKDELAQALSYYVQGEQLAVEYNVPEILGEFALNISFIYQKIKNYDDAIRYEEMARNDFERRGDSINIAVAMLNLAITYKELGELVEAEKHAQNAAAIFRRMNDHANLSETYLTLAEVAEKNKNDDVAQDYLEEMLREIDLIGIEFAGPKMISRATALAKLGTFYLKKNLPLAYGSLHEAFMLGKKNNQLSVMSTATDALSRYWELKGRQDSALYYARLHNDYYREQVNADNVRELAYQSAKFEFQQELRAKEVEQLKAESAKRRNYLILSIVIGLLIITSVLLFFLFKLGRSRLRQAGLEKEKLKSELEFRNKELTTYVMYQVKSKEFVLSIAEKLKNNELLQNPEFKKVVREILSEIETDSGNDSWREFEIRFQRVHTDFYKKLSSQFPELTANEMRLCAFLKLNMSTKDIASVTYQSANSIDVARHRLRSKFGLTKDENLIAFLSKI
jgi:tetratricopeptide (TPR) repeat protein